MPNKNYTSCFTKRNQGFARHPNELGGSEIEQFLTHLAAKKKGESLLIIQLLYGSGLRLLECLRLRVKDVDFVELCQILLKSCCLTKLF